MRANVTVRESERERERARREREEREKGEREERDRLKGLLSVTQLLREVLCVSVRSSVACLNAVICYFYYITHL